MEFEQILTLIEAVSASSLTELKYEEKGVSLKLTKDGAQGGAAQAVVSQVIQRKSVQESMEDAVLSQSEAASERTDGMTAETNRTEDAETGHAEGNLVLSPLVGTFYSAPAEDADSFVQVGDTVKKGQVLAIVEAMKLMNEIESDYAGVVTEVLVENGNPVEYGQPLFRIR